MIDRLAEVREAIASRSNSTEATLVAGFAAVIAVGTLLLCSPWAHDGTVGLSEAFFTATSAVCVTGLVVVDTGSAFTTFGQVVILLLIQTGGIGVMSFAGLAYQVMRRPMPLRARAALTSSMVQQPIAHEFRRAFGRILLFVLLAEGLGAWLIFAGMWSEMALADAAYSAVFHAVSAFCNAGFSLHPDSMVGYGGNPLVIGAVTALIVLGGIGHPVVVDVWARLRPRGPASGEGPRRLALNSKVAIMTSGVLIVAGTGLLWVTGLGTTSQAWSTRLGGALFQSVTARTAGFNSVDFTHLPVASLFVLTALMFIGGSPGSCAGGIKTTTFAVWAATQWGRLRGHKWARLWGCHIPGELCRRGGLIIGLSVVWNALGTLVLLTSERHLPGLNLQDVLFEQVSAFGTVGLSTGLTTRLSETGRLWIAATMFIGRLGPLTLATWAFSRPLAAIRYPEGRILVG